MLPATTRVLSSSSSSLAALNTTRLPPDPSGRFPNLPNELPVSSAYGTSGARISALRAVSRDGSSVKELNESPLSIELLPIDDGSFDRVIEEARQLGQSAVIVWMASWCRKCIFLKPKLEKLAADYFPRLRFYSVDVNKVSHNLVSRAGITKMPTIQVWKDGKKEGEVIGGLKAHFVLNEVREMIESENDP